MTEGELLQLTTLGRTDISEQQYLDIIQRKTAFLFSACCEVGAILGGASPVVVDLVLEDILVAHACDHTRPAWLWRTPRVNWGRHPSRPPKTSRKPWHRAQASR